MNNKELDYMTALLENDSEGVDSNISFHSISDNSICHGKQLFYLLSDD